MPPSPRLGGVWFHARQGSIQWRIVGLLSLGSLPSALFALYLLGDIAQSEAREQIIHTSLGVMLVITSLVLLLKDRLQVPGVNQQANRLEQYREPLLVLSGVLIGLLVTLSSIGAGAVTAALLFLLYPRLPTVSVVGTDLAHAVPLAAIAGLGHLQLGHVDLALLGALLLGSIPGTALGSQIALKLPEHQLRRGLAGILLLIGLKFAF